MSDSSDEMPEELRALTDAMRPRVHRDPAAEEALFSAVDAAVRGIVPVIDVPKAAPRGASAPSDHPVAQAGAQVSRLVIGIGAFALGVAVGVVAARQTSQPAMPPPEARPSAITAHPITSAAPPSLTHTESPAPPLAQVREDASVQSAPAPLDTRSHAEPVVAVEREELSSSRVREQLQHAQRLLDDGHPAEALAGLRALDRAAIRSPVLVGLREVLAVRALRDTGRVDAARARAQGYIAAHPDSVRVRELRELIGE